MKIHLCIVTEQPLANLIPILQEKPERIALAVSMSMEAEAARFLKVLNYAGWPKECVERFDNLPASNYEAIGQRALEIEEALVTDYPEASIVYNATGGTKLMALAFMDVFGSGANRVLYADTGHGHIASIFPRQAPIPMESVMNLEIYLKVQGKTLRNRDDNDKALVERMQSRKQATKFLAENATDLEGLIGQFNRTFAPVNDGSTQLVTLELKNPPRGPWLEALRKLEKGGVITAGESIEQWTPVSSEAINYLSGGWLEEYAWFIARDCQVDDVALSLKFTDDYQANADIRNEIDVAVLHRNRLMLIECKTGNVNRDGKDQDIVYKLHSLVEDVGGRLGNGMLVSFQQLEHQTKKGKNVNTGARAASVDLLTCEKSELANLRARIQQWLESAD